ACCRRYLDDLPDPASRRAVEVGERMADGLAEEDEVAAALRGASEVAWRVHPGPHLALGQNDPAARDRRRPALAAQCCCASGKVEEASRSLRARATRMGQRQRESREQAELIRDIAGNHFRPLPAIQPAWLTWHDGTVPRLARSIYEERTFGDVGILADALEEAGCADKALLGHLRGSTLHARGCWVVDLLLGKR